MTKDGQQREREQIRLARLEADLAYFEARLEILGQPRTQNQRAQHVAYRLLYRGLAQQILKVKRRLRSI